jgi:hypothetical protein
MIQHSLEPHDSPSKIPMQHCRRPLKRAFRIPGPGEALDVIAKLLPARAALSGVGFQVQESKTHSD